MPLYRKLPHRGFNNFKFRVEYATVNVGDLEELGLEEITRDDLVVAGLVRCQRASGQDSRKRRIDEEGCRKSRQVLGNCRKENRSRRAARPS